MPRIVWQPALELGIANIDSQHKRIVGIINQLDDVLHGEASPTRVGNLLEELIDYTKTHFRDEEDLLRRFQYPQLDDHAAEHRDFVTRTKEFIRRFLDGDHAVAEQMCAFLSDWFVNHIGIEDMKYKSDLSTKGVL